MSRAAASWMRTSRVVFCVATALAASAGWAGSGFAQVADLEVLEGRVTLHRGTLILPVEARATLQHNDRIITGPRGRAHLRWRGVLEGSEVLISRNTEFRVNDTRMPTGRGPLELAAGAIRSRLLKWGLALSFMQTTSAVVGIKGTDFIVYTERPRSSQFIGIEGLIEARSRSLPDQAIELGARQWGEIAEGVPPSPPIRVPDDIWAAAQAEFAFPGEQGFGPAGGQ